MIRERELTDPHSCLNRALPGEMLFVLLGRDVSAPGTIRFWIENRFLRGKNVRTDAQIVEVAVAADAIERAQRA